MLYIYINVNTFNSCFYLPKCLFYGVALARGTAAKGNSVLNVQRIAGHHYCNEERLFEIMTKWNGHFIN